MVVFVALLQTTQYAYGAELVGFVYHHCLEAALQSLVLLKVLLILVQGGCAYRPQLATGQCRLQNVGGIHGSLSATGSHERVYLVDEQNYLAVAFHHFLHNALEALLKLALVLGSGQQRTHVEREELLVLQVLGHVAAHYALGQPLGNGRFARAGLANEYGIVLGAAREYLQHAAYLVVAAYHGVELARAGLLDEVLGILREALVVVLGTAAVNLAAPPQLAYGLQQCLLGGSGILQYAACGAAHAKQGQQQRLDAHELVAHLLRNGFGLEHHLVARCREIWLSALDAGQVLHVAAHQGVDLLWVDAELLEEELHHVGGLLADACKQVHRLNALLAVLLGYVGGSLNSLLCFDSQFVECHNWFSFLLSFVCCFP